MPPRRYKLKPDKPTSKEADVSTAVQQFLALKGWETLRTFPGRWIGYGEFWASKKNPSFTPKPRTLHPTGIPDLLAVRPMSPAVSPEQCDALLDWSGLCQFLWIELKRPGEAPTEDQRLAHDRLRRQGYTVVWCDGFAAGDGIEQPFLRTYEDLGLR